MRADVLDGTWAPPVTDGSGRDRTLLRRALALLGCRRLRAARHRADRDARAASRSASRSSRVNRDEERLALLFAAQLKRAGITAQVRLVDAVQYETRRIAFDFDMIQSRWDQSLSPGNEQAFYWSSAAADGNGSRNYMGVKSPAVDAMIAALLKAADARGGGRGGARARPRADVGASTWCRCSTRRSSGSRAGPTSSGRQTTSLHGYLPETWWRQPQTQ